MKDKGADTLKLYVLRHGETDTNILKLICGKSECDLTKAGIKQAKEVKEKLKDTNFDAILSSPLTRARITASIVASKPIKIDKRLIERDYGLYEFRKKTEVDYNGFWNYGMKNKTGESIQDLFKRIESLINDLLNQYPNGNVLLVTHSGLARGIHYYLTGIPEDNDLTKLEIPNCSYRVYELSKEDKK